MRTRTPRRPPTVASSDAELLAATERDAHAFALFYDRYEAAVAGFFMRRVGEPELAADLTAEVFAAALRAAGRFRARDTDGGVAAAWLFTIAHNTLAKSVRRGRIEADARRRIGAGVVELTDDSLERLEALDGARWVAELLERLPSEQREAVRARVLDEQSYGEIAQRLKTSELVIRKRVSRGLAGLRREIEKRP